MANWGPRLAASTVPEAVADHALLSGWRAKNKTSSTSTVSFCTGNISDKSSKVQIGWWCLSKFAIKFWSNQETHAISGISGRWSCVPLLGPHRRPPHPWERGRRHPPQTNGWGRHLQRFQAQFFISKTDVFLFLPPDLNSSVCLMFLSSVRVSSPVSNTVHTMVSLLQTSAPLRSDPLLSREMTRHSGRGRGPFSSPSQMEAVMFSKGKRYVVYLWLYPYFNTVYRVHSVSKWRRTWDLLHLTLKHLFCLILLQRDMDIFLFPHPY